MTVRSLESVHQLRYFGITHMDNLGLPLLMPMIHVHLEMVVHRVYLSSDLSSSHSELERSDQRRRLEVWLDHVVAQRAARAACTGMSIIST